MNGWRSRVSLALVIALVMKVHFEVMGDVPNTDEGMALFHVSAMLCDLAILWCAPRFVAGRLRDDTQTLCLVSVVANLVGWKAYTAYAPPIYYDTFMWGLSYVQFGRLLLVGRHADRSGCDLDFGYSGRWRPQDFEGENS